MNGRRAPIGFTLLEVLVTALVLGVVVVSGTWALSGAARAKAVLQDDPLTAPLLAREIHELAATLPREPSGVTGATEAAFVAALDSLEGASFSPPIRADRSTDTSLAGWTQQVDLSVYDVGDPSTPTADDPADGLPADGSRLYRLSVTILHEETEAGSFSWWLTP